MLTDKSRASRPDNWWKVSPSHKRTSLTTSSQRQGICRWKKSYFTHVLSLWRRAHLESEQTVRPTHSLSFQGDIRLCDQLSRMLTHAHTLQVALILYGLQPDNLCNVERRYEQTGIAYGQQLVFRLFADRQSNEALQACLLVCKYTPSVEPGAGNKWTLISNKTQKKSDARRMTATKHWQRCLCTHHCERVCVRKASTPTHWVNTHCCFWLSSQTTSVKEQKRTPEKWSNIHVATRLLHNTNRLPFATWSKRGGLSSCWDDTRNSCAHVLTLKNID